MKRLLIMIIVLMLLPSAFAEATKLRNMYEFEDQYNKYLYDCIDEFSFDARHDLTGITYMYSNGTAMTPAGIFFLDSSQQINYCGLSSSDFETDESTAIFLYRTISAITALEYSPNEVLFKDDPLYETLDGTIMESIISAIENNYEEIIKNGDSGVVASGNYDYIVNYIESTGEFGVSAQKRDT